MGRILSWTLKLALGLVVFSLLQVVILRFVPVPFTATMIMDPNGFTRDWEPLSNIDRNLVRAVIASEDGKFCAHNGFDREAMQKAFASNVRGGRLRGGSTISQQTAKNVFLWQGGGYFRKGLEAWYTLLIEAVWGKRRIMEAYLNVAETGIGTYGAEAGARRYFRHSASRLSPVEAARMAAALPKPKARAVAAPRGWQRRHGNRILAQMRNVRRDALDACVYG